MIDLPALEFRPRNPKTYSPSIGLIGCGGITVEHLSAYKKAGYRVVALCDQILEQAQRRATQFFPEAQVFDDYRQLLDDRSIEVVDVATHPADRIPILEDCLRAGKHVLSQKPLVESIEDGKKLVELADQQGRFLAVNQNARWAPHYRCIYSAIQSGLLGEVFAVHMGCHWNHTWVRGTRFESIRHLILYDYAIHWFDLVRYFLGGRNARRVFAATTRTPDQDLAPNLLAQVSIEFEQAQSTLVFDAGVRYGQRDETYIAGTEGAIRSFGPSILNQTVELCLPSGLWQPQLEGCWFPDGFHGTMGELLCAIEEDRQPSNSARDNLYSLRLCFAAVASADSGQPVILS